jgi:hypothetical protein
MTIAKSEPLSQQNGALVRDTLFSRGLHFALQTSEYWLTSAATSVLPERSEHIDQSRLSASAPLRFQTLWRTWRSWQPML